MSVSEGAPSSDELGASIIRLLRTYGETYAEIARAFASREHLHNTDAAAMIEILTAEESGMPISPAKLAERIGLSFGATSTLLNRLEDAGHVVRNRTSSDRRVVTLTSTPSVQARTDEFFTPLGVSLNNVLSSRSPEFLADFASLLAELTHTTKDHIREHPDD